MTGKASRDKGRRGETRARHILESRDYSCEDMSAGRSSCDILAIDTRGTVWSVEVKDHLSIKPRDFRKQARANAKRGTKWMVMCHWPDSRSWVVERQGMRPTFWHEGGDK